MWRPFASMAMLVAFLPFAFSAPSSAEITSLPGLNTKLPFRQYGGYITVDVPTNRNLFYWFVESQSNPSTDPLFLWLQGGPGCSSLFGFLTEHGPFRITPTLGVELNPYTWNLHANVIYLESPAGVGFSYRSNENAPTGDDETMADAYIFLQKWFQLYPEFQQNDFYVSGESYGGHYVPQLSWTILQGNKNATTKINLKGLLVGNPWTDDTIDTWSVPPFIFYHHLCSLPIWEAVLAECIDNTSTAYDSYSFTSIPPLSLIAPQPFSDRRPLRLRGLTGTCDDSLNTMFNEMGDDINQYDIYVPCVAGAGLDCQNYTAETDFLNSAAVQAAIHAKKPSVPWAVCAEINYSSSWKTVLNIYPELMANIKVTVYAGDVTYNVPALGTQAWVEGFNLKVTQGFQSWSVNGQVAGYYKKFDGITYVTVKDSGHMVPTFTPVQGQILLNNYLAGIF